MGLQPFILYILSDYNRTILTTEETTQITRMGSIISQNNCSIDVNCSGDAYYCCEKHVTTFPSSHMNATLKLTVIHPYPRNMKLAVILRLTALFLRKYGFLFYAPMGLVGNSLSIFVMMQKQNRSIPSNIYIALIAIADNLVLMFKCVLNIAQHFEMSWFLWLCKGSAFLLSSGIIISGYLIVALTLDRFVAVAFPFKVVTFCTKKRVIVTSLAVTVTAMVIRFESIFSASIVRGNCGPPPSITVFRIVWSWAMMILNSILPFLIISALNIAIVVKLHKNKTELSKFDQNATDNAHDSQLTKMLICISFAFLFLSCPVFIHIVIFKFVNFMLSPLSLAVYACSYQVAINVTMLNNSVNFLFYLMAGNKFRKDLVNSFKCGKREEISRNNTTHKVVRATIQKMSQSVL